MNGVEKISNNGKLHATVGNIRNGGSYRETTTESCKNCGKYDLFSGQGCSIFPTLPPAPLGGTIFNSGLKTDTIFITG